MKKLDQEKVIDLTDQNLIKSDAVLDNLNQESIEVYNFLSDEFAKGDVTTNYLFQFVFRSFYRLDNAGLTPAFKKKYFELMEDRRSHKSIDPVIILRELYEIPTRRDRNSVQFCSSQITIVP